VLAPEPVWMINKERREGDKEIEEWINKRGELF
jgi:hypothetical protein